MTTMNARSIVGSIGSRTRKNWIFEKGIHVEIEKFLSLGTEIEAQISGLYIGASIVISDAHLKQLFQALANGDQNHIKTLDEMILAT